MHWSSREGCSDVGAGVGLFITLGVLTARQSQVPSDVLRCGGSAATLQNLHLCVLSLEMNSDGRRSSGMLRGVGWQLLSDVSGQRICPIFKGQTFHFLDCMTIEDSTDRQSFFRTA